MSLARICFVGQTVANLALGAALLLGWTTPSSAVEPNNAAWIDAQRSQWNVPGTVAVVVQSGQPTWLYGSGLCDAARQAPCTPASSFPLASTTKFFTGLLGATLADEKTLALDAPVIDAWPQFRLSDARWSQVTLRDLLGGRTGLGSVDWPYFWDQGLTRADYLSRLPFVPMAAPFRARWAYANANFVAAGSYLEKVSGKSWEFLLTQRIFEPLDMRHSGTGAPPDTVGHAPDKSGHWIALPPTTTTALDPAAGIVSTAQDLSHFLEMLLAAGRWQGKQILPARAVQAAMAPTIGLGYDHRFYGPPGAYGFGAFLATYRSTTIVHHGGGYPGYIAHFALLPQKNVGVFVLANGSAGDFAEALTLGLLDRTLGLSGDDTMHRWLDAREPPEASSTADEARPPTRPLDAYEGVFNHPAWGDVEISRSGNSLQIRAAAFRAVLDHHRYDSFTFPPGPGEARMRLRFDADFEGTISGFTLDDMDNERPQVFSRTPANVRAPSSPR